jgi:hypothetical protein
VPAFQDGVFSDLGAGEGGREEGREGGREGTRYVCDELVANMDTHREISFLPLVSNPSSPPSLPPSLLPLLTFMVAKPTSHPLMTWCCPIVNLKGWLRFREESVRGKEKA